MVFVDPVVADLNFHTVAFVTVNVDDAAVVAVVMGPLVRPDGLVIVFAVLDFNGLNQIRR